MPFCLASIYGGLTRNQWVPPKRGKSQRRAANKAARRARKIGRRP